MGYRLVSAAVKGNQLDLVPEILRATALDGYGTAHTVASWSEVADEVLNADVSRTAPVAACVVGEWTLILSGEIAMMVFEGHEALLAFVRSRSLHLFGVVADGTTGMYGYRVVQPTGTRFVFVEGDSAQDSGTPLACEGPIVAGEYSEEHLLDVMDQLGIDFEGGLEDASPVMIWRHS